MNEFILAALATFGLAALVSNYDGAFGILLRLRRKFRVLDCTVCLSTWLALPMLYLTSIGEMTVVLAFAIIGLVIIAERIT